MTEHKQEFLDFRIRLIPEGQYSSSRYIVEALTPGYWGGWCTVDYFTWNNCTIDAAYLKARHSLAFLQETYLKKDKE